MSDNDWSLWTEPHAKQGSVEEPILDNESPDMSSLTQIDCLCEYELIQVFTYFTFKERISLSRVCQKWKNWHRKVI